LPAIHVLKAVRKKIKKKYGAGGTQGGGDRPKSVKKCYILFEWALNKRRFLGRKCHYFFIIFCVGIWECGKAIFAEQYGSIDIRLRRKRNNQRPFLYWKYFVGEQKSVNTYNNYTNIILTSKNVIMLLF